MKHHIRQDSQAPAPDCAKASHPPRMCAASGALGVADSQIVKSGQQFPAVPRPCAASDPLRRHRGGSAFQIQAEGTLVGRARRQEQGEGRRLHARHRLREQHQPIRVSVLLNR